MVQIQDDVREDMMRKMFGLLESSEGRIGADAVDASGRRFELKSGTKRSVTTARDVGLHTLEKWRGKHWLVGFGAIKSGQFEFEEVYYLSPNDMEGFCQKISSKISPDLAIWDKAKAYLSSCDMNAQEIDRLEYLVNRGYTLNNPKIPYKYILDNGVKLTDWNEQALQRETNARNT